MNPFTPREFSISGSVLVGQENNHSVSNVGPGAPIAAYQIRYNGFRHSVPNTARSTYSPHCIAARKASPGSWRSAEISPDICRRPPPPSQIPPQSYRDATLSRNPANTSIAIRLRRSIKTYSSIPVKHMIALCHKPRGSLHPFEQSWSLCLAMLVLDKSSDSNGIGQNYTITC